MTRRVFYSFHYEPDNWRAGTVRNIGTIEGNTPARDNDWEKVTKGGDSEIEKWINNQMEGRSCIVVLIGEKTAKRKWINYEIINGWNKGKGVVGIHIHKLLDKYGNSTNKGVNPFDHISFKNTGEKLSSKVKVYDPIGCDSKEVYKNISDNIGNWIEEALKIRG